MEHSLLVWLLPTLALVAGPAVSAGAAGAAATDAPAEEAKEEEKEESDDDMGFGKLIFIELKQQYTNIFYLFDRSFRLNISFFNTLTIFKHHHKPRIFPLINFLLRG